MTETRRLREFLDSEEFDAVMYRYRVTSATDQARVIQAFELVKEAILSALLSEPQAAQGQQDWLNFMEIQHALINAGINVGFGRLSDGTLKAYLSPTPALPPVLPAPPEGQKP